MKKFQVGKDGHLPSAAFVLVENEAEEGSWSESDLHLYQFLLFLFTQTGYFAISASMLSTTFFEPTKDWCLNVNLISTNSTETVLTEDLLNPSIAPNNPFHSLLVEWGHHCRSSPWTIYVSTSIMAGALFGAFLSGYLADRFGRKPIVVGSMFLVCLGNVLLLISATHLHLATLSVFFLLGTACGAYMVTNMVLLVEILQHSSTRLLVVSLNGWPMGMIGTSLLAYLSNGWRMYHLCIAIFSFVFFVIIYSFAFESIPWLIHSGRRVKARNVQRDLNNMNTFLAKADRHSAVNLISTEGDKEEELNGDSAPQKEYTYLDLFRHRPINLRLITLLFCFGSSSIISFGLYFSAEVLPGSRYVNLATMGMSKLVLGFLPFIFSNCLGRRPIMLISVGLSGLAAWALLCAWMFSNSHKHWAVTVLGLFLTAAIDPNWKIMHLLSMELFPTPVRNMARGLCNVVARLGSLSGPWVIFLRSFDELLPFWLFAVLLTIQFIVSLCFIPETRGQPLPDQMPSQINHHHHHFRQRTLTRHSIRSAHSLDVAIA